MISSICPKCGLPKSICVCGEIAKEGLLIKIYLEPRKWNKKVTIITGIDETKKLSRILKHLCACGGSCKDNRILLQGDHREVVKKFLLKEGYLKENIEVL